MVAKRINCRSCGEEILIMTTKAGISVAVSPDPVAYMPTKIAINRVMTADGDLVRCSLTGPTELMTGIGYEIHRATCAKATGGANAVRER